MIRIVNKSRYEGGMSLRAIGPPSSPKEIFNVTTSSQSIDSNQVEQWLRDLQCDPVPGVDPNANWRFEVNYPPNTLHKISVVNPKMPSRAVIVACAVNLSPMHLAAFERLEHDKKQAFSFALQESLNRDHVEFQLQGGDVTGTKFPTRIQLMSVIFDDGLTLDTLAQRLLQLMKAEVGGGICINRFLGPVTDTWLAQPGLQPN
jgi:hypothetical protein